MKRYVNLRNSFIIDQIFSFIIFCIFSSLLKCKLFKFKIWACYNFYKINLLFTWALLSCCDHVRLEKRSLQIDVVVIQGLVDSSQYPLGNLIQKKIVSFKSHSLIYRIGCGCSILTLQLKISKTIIGNLCMFVYKYNIFISTQK